MYATCDNDVGYYQCTCNEGFSGDGFGVLGCSDLDECQSNPCLATEYCVNTMGSPWILNFMLNQGYVLFHRTVCDYILLTRLY